MPIEGVLLMDKQLGLSSFEAVEQLRRILNTKKVGHTGTLDPGATGLLVAVLGKATKISAYLSGQDKLYRAVIRLGERRETYDRFGKLIYRSSVNVTESEVRKALKTYKGEIEQIVPAYSAAHHEGRRMYEYARKGKKVPVKYSNVRINSILMIDYDSPFVKFDINCTSGTYIRSLAEMLGNDLGCGAHLYSLRRLEVGRFCVENALTLRQLQSVRNMELLDNYMISIENALDFPVLIVADSKAEAIKNGVEIKGEDIIETESTFEAGQIVMVKDQSGKMLALCNALVSIRQVRHESHKNSKVVEYKRVL